MDHKHKEESPGLYSSMFHVENKMQTLLNINRHQLWPQNNLHKATFILDNIEQQYLIYQRHTKIIYILNEQNIHKVLCFMFCRTQKYFILYASFNSCAIIMSIRYHSQYINLFFMQLMEGDNDKERSNNIQAALNEDAHEDNHEKSIIDERVFFKILQKVGSYGKYQILTTVIWSTVGYLSGGFMLITPYLFYQDPYVCHETYPGKTCFEHVCSLDLQERVPFIPKRSMITIGNSFGDYRCPDEKLVLDSMQTLMYIGAVIGFVAMLLIGGYVGRKTLMLLCLISFIIGMIVSLFCVNLMMVGIGLCICSIGATAGYNVCFMFLTETISELYRQKLSVIIQLFYGVGVLANCLWFYAIGNWYLILTLFYFLPAIACMIAVVYIVKDTPICLVLRKSPEKAFSDFKFIAKMNKINNQELTEQEIRSVKSAYNENMDKQQSQKNFTVIDLFRFKSLRLMTVILFLLQCAIIFEFYAPALMMDSFKLSLFINGLVIGLSELIAYPICYVLIMRSKRRHIAYGCFGITFVCSIILLFLWNQDDENPDIGSSIGVLIFIFIFRFAISVQYTFFYIYFNELYPTQIRVIGTSLVSVMGGIIVTLAPEIIDFFLQRSYPIMILFAVFSGLGVILSKMLPQTFQVSPPDVIQELIPEALPSSFITDNGHKYNSQTIADSLIEQNQQKNKTQAKGMK